MCVCLFFFFQAEDGIRDLTVTGVQTCALPISVAVRRGLRDDVPGLERGGTRRHRVVHVRDVVRDGVEPLAVGRGTRGRDPDRVEDGHQAPPLSASEIRLNLLSIARSASWYRRPVSMLDSVSSSRLTLLPFSWVGSRDSPTVGRTLSGAEPFASADCRAPSNLTLPAWKPGVWMLAMLFAVTRWRMARPDSATRRDCDVTSSTTVVPSR